MFEQQFDSPELAAILTAEKWIENMLRFEAALAGAQGELGLIPAEAARVIVRVCRDPALPTWIDLSVARVAGNSAIPLVKQLTEAVRTTDASAADWVHFGATSQDVIDTATMLALREVFEVHVRELKQLRARLAHLAAEHAETRMLARTLLQQASLITFGLKAAQWLSGLDEAATELGNILAGGLYLQLGGPVGSLAAFSDQAAALSARMAAELKLEVRTLPWHTNRAPVVRCANALAVLTMQLGKLAQDVVLAMQTEVSELSEGYAAGKGGSSSMPHKHNPVDALTVLAAATAVPQLAAGLLAAGVQEHERAAGAWHAEWMLLPQLCRLSHAALRASVQLVNGLQVDSERMSENVVFSGGQIFAAPLADVLAKHMSRSSAQALAADLCAQAARERKPLADIALRELSALRVGVTATDIHSAVSGERETSAAAARARRYLQQRQPDA